MCSFAGECGLVTDDETVGGSIALLLPELGTPSRLEGVGLGRPASSIHGRSPGLRQVSGRLFT